MYETNYHRASSVADAASLFGQGDDVKYLAGGMTLIATMKQRLASPSDLVDLGRVAELKGISVNGSTVRIGAGTTHFDVASNADLRRACKAITDLAGMIGDPHVRHMGTIGGSVANNDPAADYPAALVGLGATVETTGRAIPADDFFLGLFTTALEPGELILRIRFPIPARAGYHKFANIASGYVTTGAFVSDGPAGLRVAVNGAGPCVFRQTDAETRLARDFSPAALDGFAQPDAGLNNDLHASAAYRAQLVAVAIRRALAMALGHRTETP